LIGKSERQVQQLVTLGTTGTAELLQAVDAGRITRDHAEKVARLPAKEQRAEVRKVSSRKPAMAADRAADALARLAQRVTKATERVVGMTHNVAAGRAMLPVVEIRA
jgi:hypothetical protein